MWPGGIAADVSSMRSSGAARLWIRGKRLADLVLAGSALVVLAPLMAAIALAVLAFDGRPVLYKGGRLGRGGQIFRMYKFRTMRPGSDRNIELNPDGSLRIVEDDPRVTRLGRFLRRYSLDELPQLLNVLKGEMSLVGPRPDLPVHEGAYDAVERRKLLVRPGITGLAQVSGRNALAWKDRLRLDVEYVDRSSPGLDAWILARTFLRVIRADGIYNREAGTVDAAQTADVGVPSRQGTPQVERP